MHNYQARFGRQGAIGCGAVLACIFLAHFASAQLPPSYDPATCNGDAHEKLYLALGQNVLAVPATGRRLVSASPPFPEDLKRRPPDRSESEGCPNNPQQLLLFSISYPGAEKLTLHFAAPGVDPPFWERDQIQQADWMCGENPPIRKIQAKLREELPNGFPACRETLTKEEPIEEWAAAYIAHSEVYATPYGRRFIAICGYAVNRLPVGGCDVSYGVVRELALSYTFSPRFGSKPVPMNELVAFDGQVRAFVDDMRVKNYVWPTP